jgi:hypothetical protein
VIINNTVLILINNKNIEYVVQKYVILRRKQEITESENGFLETIGESIKEGQNPEPCN